MRSLKAVLSNLDAVINSPEAAKREAEFRALEARQERADREQRLRRADIWPALRPADRAAIVAGTLDPAATHAGRVVRRWRERGGDWPVLVLQGPSGCGKSIAAAWYVANHPIGGVMRGATAVASAWSSTTNRAADERDAMCSAAVLELDDVGTEFKYQIEAVGAALRELLETRQGLRTIITTNLTQEAWTARYPDVRLSSRMERAAWVPVHGSDLRKRAG